MRSFRVALLFVGVFQAGAAGAQLVPVAIDIAPGDPDNVIDLGSRAPLDVAILGSEAVDVDDLDVDSMVFGPDAAPPLLPGWIVSRLSRGDVNGDEFTDLVVAFSTQASGIAAGDTGACLSGSGAGFGVVGCSGLVVKIDEVFRCGLGAELALVLPVLLWWRRRLAG